MKVVTANIFKGDRTIWALILLLSIFSLLAVYSSTGTLAFRYQGGSTFYYLLRHAALLIIGVFLILIFQNISVKMYQKLSFVFILMAVPLLLFTLLRGVNLNEASRWITLPGTSISFQSSDFGKFALIVYIARFLAKHQDDTAADFKRDFSILMAFILLICGLILPANLSTASLLFFTSLMLLFLGRVKIKYIFRLLGIGGLIAALFITVALLFFQNKGRISTWKNRIENYISGEEDNDKNFQVEQSKIAIASGGFFGKGPGNSTQRNFLPHPYSDFIFAIIIEEYGFWGAFIVLFAYLVLFFRAGIIVKRSRTAFPAFLAVGLILSLVLQSLINMGVATDIFPVTGQTLPLVSMGGTSIIFTSLSLGIILNVSILNSRVKEKGGDDDEDTDNEKLLPEVNKQEITDVKPQNVT